MSLQKLFESIFDFQGKVKEQDNKRKILINRNPKQIDIMNKLAHGFEIINNMRVKDINGLVYKFSLV